MLNHSLYEYPEVDKIIAIRYPMKHKTIMISEVMNIIENKSKLPLNEKHGHPDNFKFLIKWKNRDYSSLTWED